MVNRGFTAATSVSRIIKGLPKFTTGCRLCRKKNKTEYEAKAAKSFVSLTIGSFILAMAVVACGVAMFVMIMSGGGTGYSKIIHGNMDDGEIIYEQYGEQKSLSAGEAGIDSDTPDDEDILIFLDYRGEPVRACTSDEYNAETNRTVFKIIVMLILCCVGGTAFGMYLHSKPGKEWNDYYKAFEAQKAADGTSIP